MKTTTELPVRMRRLRRNAQVRRLFAETTVEMRTLVPGYPGVIKALDAAQEVLTLPHLHGGPARVLSGSSAGLDLLVLDAAHLFARPGNPYSSPEGTDWPDNVAMVGPCDWEPPTEPPTWLADVDQPIVLVTTSSEFQNDGRLVGAALEALAGEPVHVVATLHRRKFMVS